MTDKFSYSVVLCPFLPWPCILSNMVVGGLIATDDGGAGHLLLWAIECSEYVESMGRWMIWVSDKNNHQRKMDSGDGSVEAIIQGGSGLC